MRRNTARVSQVRKIRVVGASGSRVANVAFGTVADQCHLTVTLDDGRTVSADASDYFESLLLVRRELEHDGLLVCCQGARRDVWPSGMARDMGAGLKAYVLSIGRQPSQKDLVDIFDPAEQSLIGTVAEQEGHFQKWWASVRA